MSNLPFLATKTLALIDKTIALDQGAGFRKALRHFMPLMEDAYREDDKPYRNHLGFSLIGRDCPRELWYGFRWVKTTQHEGKLLRLFNRGHLEEARFLAMLSILPGVTLWYQTEDGGQFKLSHFNGHAGSALDGVVMGLPELPKNVAALLEFKTANEKSFTKIQKEGVRSAKLEHFTQMQVCMKKANLKYAFYMVVNKNTDELYAEIIKYDDQYAYRALDDRGHAIIFSETALPRIHASPGWYQCKFCDYLDICKKYKVPDINCRTCYHSKPEENGSWSCGRGHSLVNEEGAMQGCQEHIYDPALLQDVKFIGFNQQENAIEIVSPTGRRVILGDKYTTSKELKEKGSL